jgi:hypothetical protein
MGTLDLSLSRTMHQPMHAAAPLLNAASSFRRMPIIACRPSPCFLRRCHADARHDKELFPDDLSIPAAPRLAEVLSLSRTRTPHAVSSTAFVFIDRVEGSSHTSFEFQNSAPLFQLPLNYFSFSSTTGIHLICPVGKRNKPCGERA